jgi:hypothetical protein
MPPAFVLSQDQTLKLTAQNHNAKEPQRHRRTTPTPQPQDKTSRPTLTHLKPTQKLKNMQASTPNHTTKQRSPKPPPTHPFLKHPTMSKSDEERRRTVSPTRRRGSRGIRMWQERVNENPTGRSWSPEGPLPARKGPRIRRTAEALSRTQRRKRVEMRQRRRRLGLRRRAPNRGWLGAS